MADNISVRRLETESLVIGYAMSRLDAGYLLARRCRTWKQAYDEAASALTEPPASFKNLRDEFDPMHGNARAGWRNRALRPTRQRVIDELFDVSDAALMELVGRILKRDEEATAEAIDSLAGATRVAYNVAERLLTGRLAEEYFLEHSQRIVSVERPNLTDLRQAACGYDFGVVGQPDLAIEVKGLKQTRGRIQFTDREWTEARLRDGNYWVVVVGGLPDAPVPRVIRDPAAVLHASCTYHTAITALWGASVDVSKGA